MTDVISNVCGWRVALVSLTSLMEAGITSVFKSVSVVMLSTGG